jgi:hypothetical protein
MAVFGSATDHCTVGREPADDVLIAARNCKSAEHTSKRSSNANRYRVPPIREASTVKALGEGLDWDEILGRE